MTSLLVHNGPLTLFRLKYADRRLWHLCRDDLTNFTNGKFEFDDCRHPIDLGDTDKANLSRHAARLLRDIEGDFRFADFLGYWINFCDEGKTFGQLTESDLGRKFHFENVPYVLLGALEEESTFSLAGFNLVDGLTYGFTVEGVETLLNGIGETAEAEPIRREAAFPKSPAECAFGCELKEVSNAD